MELNASSYAGWGVALVLGLPFCIIVLNELIDRIKPGRSEYGAVLRFARDLVLPFLVLVMVLRLIFGVETTNILANLVSTIFWGLLIVFIFRVTRVVLGNGQYEEGDWRAKVPQLFLRLPPYTLIGLVAYHVVQTLWALPVRELVTTLGIGSIVIAFALQATLSNMVSGVLLVANSPFKTGDWINFGDVEGKIIDVTWRYTHIENWNGDLVVIPNGAIADEAIINHSRPTPNTLVEETLVFSYSVPPNEIKRMLEETMTKTPGILADPAPAVSLVKLENPFASYLIEFWINDYETKPDVLQDCLTRVWYAARRYGIEVPMNAQEIHPQRARPKAQSTEAAQIQMTKMLRDLPIFEQISDPLMDLIVQSGQQRKYAATERILDVGETEPGVFLVLEGSVEIEKPPEDAGPSLTDTCHVGSLFGVTGLFARPISPINALAEVDCELLLLPHAVFNQILSKDAKLNDQLNDLINQHSFSRKNVRMSNLDPIFGNPKSAAKPERLKEVTNGE